MARIPWNKGRSDLPPPWNKGKTRGTDARIAQPWLGKKRPEVGTRLRKPKVLLACKKCHKQFLVIPSLADVRKYCSKSCAGSVRIGPLCGNWIADRTKIKVDTFNERGSPLHKQWSRDVKNRDGWKCKISNSDCSGRLESHHILGWIEHPTLRYNTNNGITLCHYHHPRKREDEKRLSPYFQSLVASEVK